MSTNANMPVERARFARIRCLQDCIDSFQNRKPFPSCLCYVPSELEYKASSKITWKILTAPSKSADVLKEVSATPSSRLIVSGEELCNKDGKWLKVIKVKTVTSSEYVQLQKEGWLLLFTARSSTEDLPIAVPVRDGLTSSNNKTEKPKFNMFAKQNVINSWKAVVEETYSLVLKKHKAYIIPPDEDAVKALQRVEDDWGPEHDGALTQFMSQWIPKESEDLGCLKDYVESLAVSSFTPGEGEMSNLTDEDSSTYWETDGSQGEHWVRLRMKKGTIIKNFTAIVNQTDDNYLPEHIVVLGGNEIDEHKVLNNIHIDWDDIVSDEIKLLDGCTEHHPTISVRIKSCKSGGIDTRLYGLKMTCLEERNIGLSQDVFTEEALVRFPILQTFSPSVLYKRAIVLERFTWLLDSVIHYLVPSWQTSLEGVTVSPGGKHKLANLESIRQLLPLSRKRMSVIETLLKTSALESTVPKVLYINRHAALEHRANPSASPDLSKTVFNQVYQGLRPTIKNAVPLSYRWTSQYDQWWECKFIAEGVIDQGGGFRDSLSDIAEELCPSDPNAAMALPYFIRAPNQGNEDGNVNQDVYIPNPSCDDMAKYEWIGQLMGACFRGKEILIVSLAPYVWKKLVDEKVTWVHDYISVDAAEVRLIDSLSIMDPETFALTGRSWNCLLSDGTQISMKVDEDGNPRPLAYEDREDYAQQVRDLRMTECDKQLKGIKSGLLKVIPEAVLCLLSWQELEIRICGEPEISVEGMIKSTYYFHIEEDDQRVKYFWSAVRKFSNEDRSRLLRFITGRRRLPVSIFISTGKNNPIDPLPESSTCANTIHLPIYSSEKIAEEKLRYAAYNCVSIDTDEYDAFA